MAGGHAHLNLRVALRPRAPVLARVSDRDGVICGAELHHIDTTHRQKRLEIVDGLLLLDHERADGVVVRVHPRGRAALQNNTNVALHADAMDPGAAAHAWALGACGANALLDLLHGARVGKE